MSRFLIIALTFLYTSPTYSQNKINNAYTPDWPSLSKHDEAPEWFKDAKFGIYFHWGLYSVAAYGDEWYPRHMFFEGSRENKYHSATYGSPAKFGYHDFAPLFKAEKFNAAEWAALFKKAGAQFAGPVAEHHDGFSMWASKVNPWNVKDMGPKRDITGELEKAIRKEGMKLITTFHHERQLQRYAGKPNEKRFDNSHFPYLKGMPTSSTDPKLRILYGNIPEKEWLEKYWFGKLKEVIDGYRPDIIWFDSWLDEIPEAYRKKFLTYYLNAARKTGQEVVVVRKQNDLPLEVSVDDLEKSRKNVLEPQAWMTDETISKGSWSYTTDLQIKTAPDIIHVLADIASKNGVLLLNISPMANGAIPQEQQQVLLEIGKWLNANGEAIYGTRPWYTFGEGPTKEPVGNFSNADRFLKIKYSEKDIRYTTKVGAIYATILGKPVAGSSVLLQSFSKKDLQNRPEIRSVSILGTNEPVKWNLEDNGLRLTVPAALPEQAATVFKISVAGFDGAD